MAIRLDQLPRDTQQQILARLEEQGLLVRERPRRNVKQEPASDQPSALRKTAAVAGYAAMILSVAVFVLLQAPGSDSSRSYPVLFARVFVHVVRESWLSSETTPCR